MDDQHRAAALTLAVQLVRDEQRSRQRRRENDCGLCFEKEQPSADALGGVARELEVMAAATSPVARERLARHLWLTSRPGDPYAQAHWDHGGDQHVNKAAWRAKADAALAAITGTEN